MNIRTTIEINASPERVWYILTEFEKYPEWNPFITEITGILSPGEKLKVKLHPPGKKVNSVKPVVLKVVENKEFVWLGHLFFPGVFDAQHHFTIEPVSASSVLFNHNEHFSGIMLPVFWRMLHHHVRIGFIEMNRALKKRAENIDNHSSP